MVVGALVAVPTAWAGAATALREDPADVVEDYFAAIVAKDVDAALALVDRDGTGVPIGAQAVFLDPGAIADGWRLESAVEEFRDDEEGAARVEVMLASRHGSATGELLLVTSEDRPWRLYSPLVPVEVPASPLAFFQANGLTVPLDAVRPQQFWLFPGLYEFYPQLPPGVTGPDLEPVMAFPTVASHRPTARDPRPRRVAPGRLSATGPVLAAVEQQLAGLLDECADFSTPEPHGCPFATDGEIDTPDGHRVRDPEQLDWRVTGYPSVSLVDDRPDDGLQQPGFWVVAETSGAVELTGSGIDTDGRRVSFTVECDVQPEWLGRRARITVTGAVELITVVDPSTLSHDRNTCHRNP
jgi:hypothetical protein